MDLSEITSSAGSYPTTLRATKVSDVKITKPSKTQDRKVRPIAVYVEDLSEFRSIVQRLTGLPPTPASSSIDTVSDKKTITGEIKAFEDMKHCLKTLASAENLDDLFEDVFAECLDCLAYCSVFPDDYELERDTLVQLWMAAGLVKDEPMEDIAAAYLTAIYESGDIISLTREDHGTGKVWYKVNGSKVSQQVLELSRINLVKVVSNDPLSVLSVKTEPCHVMFEQLPMNLEVLRRFTQMRGVLLLRGNEFRIDRVPYDFFMSLELIQTLDLSGTRLTELPSSVGNARALRYLDLSETLLKRLPETIDGLQRLQTLKLRNCPRLVALPKGTRRLTSLRHLDLGPLCRLHSMPLGIGALSGLCTLSDFVVNRQNGCQIGELKNMNNLRGRFCLSRLENVASLHEAMEANLSNKHRLTKLELRWTDDIIENDDDQVLEHLKPPENLQELRILCYVGLKFPSWINDQSLDKLVSITLFKCENCQLLPSLGQLPSLESLSLIELVGVRIIDSRFCGDISTGNGDQFVAFPVLQKLEIKSMVNLEEWVDIRKHDFPLLTKFTIKDCPKLVALCRLSSLQSLEYLEIKSCHKLPSLPEGELPPSVKTLVLDDCLWLSMGSSMEDAIDWHKIEHSPSLLIYQRDNKGKHEALASSSITNAQSN